MTERDCRRARSAATLVRMAGFPVVKTLEEYDFKFATTVPHKQIEHLAALAFVARRENVVFLGRLRRRQEPSRIRLALIENGWRVLFTRTTDLVQKLQVAHRELGLEAAINRLDRYHLLILDDLAYVAKDQAETSVLFELISARYERRSMLITANQPFGEWGKIFPDPAMMLAAVDRLVHHATIFEMNVESYRRRVAIEKKRGRGRPASYATPVNTAAADAPRQSD